MLHIFFHMEFKPKENESFLKNRKINRSQSRNLMVIFIKVMKF